MGALSEEVTGWSESEDRRLGQMWLAEDPPRSIREIAYELQKSKSSVDRRITALGYRSHKGDRDYYEKVTGVSLEPVIKAVRMDNLPAPTGEPLGTKYKTLVWGDVHFPFQDRRAVDILYQIAQDLQPDVLVCIGDVFDFFELSPEYRSPKDQEPDMQLTLNEGVQHLGHMLSLTNPKEAHFLGGNHEDRWDRLLDKARKDIRFRQLLKLPIIQRSMTFENVIGFQELGYQYHPYMEGGNFVENDALVYTHGFKTTTYATRSLLDKFGKSVMFGHTHRIQNFTRRDLKGQESAWNIGCLSTLAPHYDHFADWTQGFAIVEWFKVADKWLFNVEQIRIHDGITIWRDKVYISQHS